MNLIEIIKKIPHKPYYIDGDKENPNGIIFNNDCLEVLPHIPEKSIDLVLTDPPYGVNMLRGDSKVRERILNDDKPPNLKWVAKYSSIIWGGNNFCDQLPRSTGWLVWYKYCCDKSEHSQAELAWTNCVKTIRHYSEQFTGFMRQREGQYHPTQKPTGLMRWCIRFNFDAKIIIDPYFGVGSTGIACKQLSRKFIGIEIEEKYCRIATERLQGTPENLPFK